MNTNRQLSSKFKVKYNLATFYNMGQLPDQIYHKFVQSLSHSLYRQLYENISLRILDGLRDEHK